MSRQISSVVLPLAALSLMPHQEPRFLLPMMLPLTLLYAPSIDGTAMVLAWTLWHAPLAAFFSFTHQAAVVPAVAALQQLSIPTRACSGSGATRCCGGC